MVQNQALRNSRGSYTARLDLDDNSQNDIQWWIDNIQRLTCRIQGGRPSVFSESDVSTKGWGAYCEGKYPGGDWTQVEPNDHINVL